MGYMPMLAATSGTLSTMADNKPMATLIRYTSPKAIAQPIRSQDQMSRLLQCRYSQQNAQEKHDRSRVDFAQHAHHTQGLALLFVFGPVQHLSGQPQAHPVTSSSP